MSSIEAKVVVGIDFGTTYSGFAFAHRANPSKVYALYLYPETDGTYCKTKTELYYTMNEIRELVLQSWGGKAVVDYAQAASSASPGELIRKFKLCLAGPSLYGSESSAVPKLPGNLNTDIVITDYLREISKFCMKCLRDTYGSKFSMEDVQWCLTVPAIWDDRAKQLMKSYAEAAGLVRTSNPTGSSNEGSPYPLVIVLEPEAAAVYCLAEFNHLSFDKGDKFMTADLGGGTVDIVIHEKIWQSSSDGTNLEMREVAKSSGGLCGATYVDEQFVHHLHARIPCFEAFTEEHPSTLLQIMKWWDGIKVGFNGTESQRWLLPSNLAEAWKLDDRMAGRPSRAQGYGDMEFTKEDLIGIFEPVVKKVIQLIDEALRPFALGEVKIIMAVGGFSGNPYLKKRLRDTFTPGRVNEIVVPPNSGGAICQGAVMLGIAHKNLIVSRVSRKTYGQAITRAWTRGDPEEFQLMDDDGVLNCTNVFQIFVRKGEEVPADHYVTEELTPLYHNERTMPIRIYSSDESTNPKYITDEGMVQESEFELDISSGLDLDKARRTAVTMYFGRTSIEVTAKGVNFKASGGAGKAISVAFRDSPLSSAKSNFEDDLEKRLARMRTISLPHDRSRS